MSIWLSCFYGTRLICQKNSPIYKALEYSVYMSSLQLSRLKNWGPGVMWQFCCSTNFQIISFEGRNFGLQNWFFFSFWLSWFHGLKQNCFNLQKKLFYLERFRGLFVYVFNLVIVAQDTVAIVSCEILF